MGLVKRYFEEEGNEKEAYLRKQIEDCGPRNKSFLNHGFEYLCFCGIYELKEITDQAVDQYPLWLRQHGVTYEPLLKAYQGSLKKWKQHSQLLDYAELVEELRECKEVNPTLLNKVQYFLVQEKVHHLKEMDYELRERYAEFLSHEINGKVNQSAYLKEFDRIKLHQIREAAYGPFVGKVRLQLEEKKIYLAYHPDYRIAKKLFNVQNKERLVWDFSLSAEKKLKQQTLDVINYALEHTKTLKELDVYIRPLKELYLFCVREKIPALDLLELEQKEKFLMQLHVNKKLMVQCRQIPERVFKVLFLMAPEINWKANVWYLERFSADETRYNPARIVNRISFLEIRQGRNRDIAKEYLKYQLGVSSCSIQNIFQGSYIIKAFLIYLDGKGKYVDALSGTDIDAYFRLLGEEKNKVETFNDKVERIYAFFRFLTARGYYKKIPFYQEYYRKKAIYEHHNRTVPENTVTQILHSLVDCPEDLRLMYLHLWCLGLRINEVCMIRKNGYYTREDTAWLRIYQSKLRMEKVIPIPMVLYKLMMFYIEKKGIEGNQYVFQNKQGGPYSANGYWHQMVDFCNAHQIRCKDHIFQTHDYRHSIATMLYKYGASIQVIRDFLGHKHENMTKQYIDCIQESIDQSSQEYYESKESLAGEWKRRYGASEE